MEKLSIRLLAALLVMTLMFSCRAQQLPLSTNEEDLDILTEAKIMKLDKLQHLYLISQDNELKKMDSNGRLLYSYSNNALGELTQLDVTNPLKLILFYPDHQLVISLDNTLSEIGRYDLQAFGYNEVQVVALSNDNQLWLYDPEEFSLKKINDQGNLVLESFSLVSENIGALNPISLKERNNKVYLNDPVKGILEFDNFGQFIGVIPLQGAVDFQIETGGIVYFDGKAIFRYDPYLFESHRINMKSIDFENVKSVHLTKEKIHVLKKGGVKILPIEN